MRRLLIFLVLLIVISVGVASYLGFVPILSSLLVHPRNLGITPNAQLVADFPASHLMINELPGGVIPADRDGIFVGSKRLDISLDSAQASAVFAHWKKLNPRFPLRDVQVVFHPDGRTEASGILELGTAVSLALGLGYSHEQIEQAQRLATFINGDLPFYVTGTGYAESGAVTLLPTTFQLGNVTVPESITAPAATAVADMIERTVSRISGAKLDSARIEQGKIRVQGSIPELIK